MTKDQEVQYAIAFISLFAGYCFIGPRVAFGLVLVGVGFYLLGVHVFGLV